MGTVLLACSNGCGSSGRGLADDDVAFKAPAIKAAVDARRQTAEPDLVAALEDDDAAVRFYAIGGLRRLTGRTFGYHYYDDADARRPAVGRWGAWLRGERPTDAEDRSPEGTRP